MVIGGWGIPGERIGAKGPGRGQATGGRGRLFRGRHRFQLPVLLVQPLKAASDVGHRRAGPEPDLGAAGSTLETISAW